MARRINQPFTRAAALFAAIVLCGMRQARAADGEGAWPPGPDSGFRAHVYPSLRWAAVALGRDAAAATARQSADAITVFLPDDDDHHDAWRDAVDAVRRESPGTEVVVRQDSRPPDVDRPAAGEVWIEFTATESARARVPWSREKVAEGRIEARVIGRAAPETLSARYLEKPWVSDAPGFLAGRGGERWVVGGADRPCASRAEAEQAALADAARRLAERVGPDGSHETVRRRALVALGRGELVADRFTRRFDRPYGQVWDSTVLVDASPQALKRLAREARAERSARRQAALTAAAGGGAFALVVALAYAVVNGLTRGYFVWRLRAAAAALLLLAGAGAAVMLVAAT